MSSGNFQLTIEINEFPFIYFIDGLSLINPLIQQKFGKSIFIFQKLPFHLGAQSDLIIEVFMNLIFI